MSHRPRHAPIPPGFLNRRPAHWLALGLGCGLSPKAPGTVGTLPGWPLAWGLGSLPGPDWLPWVVWTMLFLVGVRICRLAGENLGVHDHQAIVLDEVIAFALVVLAFPLDLRHGVIGFLLFRFFDIVKPFPIRWIDAHTPGGWGVMLDDLAAAALAILVLHGLVQLMEGSSYGF